MTGQSVGTMTTIVLDGRLEKAEALRALRVAAQQATDALPKALKKCKNNQQMQKIIGDRDTIVLAYLTCLRQSLLHTGPHFENLASDLEQAAKDVKQKAKSLKDATEAINLLAGVVGLAASLALAFA